MKLSARDWRHYAAATTIFLLAFPVFAHLSPSLADGIPSEIGELIKEEGIANEQCRGGSGDNPETQQACDKRDQIVSKLKEMGWCYGTDDQPMYQRQWQPCRTATKLNDTEALRKAPQKVGEATKDPQAVKLMECVGVKVYQDPQPPGHPPTADECNQLLRDADSKRANSAASGGIGIRTKVEQGQIIVNEVVPGLPAAEAGVRAQDVIETIDGKSVSGLSGEQVSALIRGPVGKEVDIVVRHADGTIGRFQMGRIDIASVGGNTNVPQATDPAGAKFAAEVAAFAKVLRTGRAAIYCGIRSQHWYRSLEAGLTMGIDGREQQLRGQAANVALFNADADRARKWAGPFIVGAVPSREECMRLIDSPELARADELQRRTTGGYR